MSKTIMAVGAHTGDAQLTCGMLLAKHSMLGDKIITVDLTAGERGAPQGVPIAEFRERNVASAREFAAMLGGESIVFDVPDGELYAGKDIELQLADLMRERQVDAVLYHWKNSLHKDHVAAHRITENAIFFASLATMERACPPAPIRAMLCAENWEDAEGFAPYHYFDVTEAFPLWKEAIKKLWLAEHSTSFAYLRYYEALSVCRGAFIRKEHATAFSDTSSARRVVRESL
ncbi:MAG: PIG-L family deacetylase [Christensenellales bacterium]|uniref:PIG-L family deacetylase n=1 Tax=Candidatus Avichristensenella intestinipullorum TaxID=2840693 RepID=A0A9D1CJF4_9FIRM|nr:PIG-L family deacetylase [Christensenellales bacterium]HIQ63755.1 PIG-L family deacetylase [Candidatus Avichristensenella intestinipullorum]